MTPAAASAGPTVYDAIVAVAGALAHTGLSKSRQNKDQNYQFRGIDDVFNALAPLLVKHRLVILPRVLGRTMVERATRNGGVLFCVTVEMAFDFVSAVDGSTHTVQMYGEAMDIADKATNKAMSAAYKYAALQTFCIPTEAGECDADAVTPPPLAAPRGPIVDVALVPIVHPEGYLAWLDSLRLTAQRGTPALESAWFQAPKAFRIHLKTHAPDLVETLKAIAARTGSAAQQSGAAS